jgi:hypothetical protein
MRLLAPQPFGRLRPPTLGVVLILAGMWFVAPRTALACDMCAIYTATELQETRTGLRAGVAEQYTRFGRLQENGVEVPNVIDQHINSSITQLIFGYVPIPRLGLQVNVPVIDRSFRRSGGTGVQTGDVAGFGDLSLVASGLAYSLVTENMLLRLTGLFGLKLPSGNPSQLQQELATPTPTPDPCAGIPQPFCHPTAQAMHARHTTITNGIPSAVHGHDLALGSGSTDVIFGGQGLWTWKRLYGTAALQYVVNTTGAFDYRYANGLNVGGTVGGFAFLEHDFTLGFEAVLTCETKGNDTVNGQPETDTGLTALYAGPGVRFTWGSTLSAEVVGDIPAIENNSGFQVVPSYRVRGGLVWRF